MFGACTPVTVYIPGPSYSKLQYQLSAHCFPGEEFLSSLYCNRVPGSVTCSCVPGEHMKYHPMGDDTVPASASSDQDSVLKWSTCIFLLRVGELGKFGEGDRIREGNLSNRKW